MKLYPDRWGRMWLPPAGRERVIVFINGKRRKMWRRPEGAFIKERR